MSILRKTYLASLGALEVTKAKAEALIDELIAKGEVSQTDRSEAIMELLHKAESAGQRLGDSLRDGAEKVEKRFSDLAHELRPARQSDLELLQAEVAQLRAEVAALRSRLEQQS